MCTECGCGLPGAPGTVRIHAASGTEPAAHAPHAHPGHAHDHGPGYAPAEGESRTVTVQRSLLEKNDRLAERNRGFFAARNLLVLNLLSSPGAGKTTLLQKSAELLRDRLRVGVIVGDLATENDARRLREAGLPVVQVTTGTICHLDAEMVARAMRALDLEALDVLIIENVGNLVCPASYDLGEALRVVLMSVTEGEDKPLKYPTAFHSAQLALITKSDLAEAVEFDREQALANLAKVAHHARILEVSARNGTGLAEWRDFLVEQHRQQVASASA